MAALPFLFASEKWQIWSGQTSQYIGLRRERLYDENQGFDRPRRPGLMEVFVSLSPFSTLSDTPPIQPLRIACVVILTSLPARTGTHTKSHSSLPPLALFLLSVFCFLSLTLFLSRSGPFCRGGKGGGLIFKKSRAYGVFVVVFFFSLSLFFVRQNFDYLWLDHFGLLRPVWKILPNFFLFGSSTLFFPQPSFNIQRLLTQTVNQILICDLIIDVTFAIGLASPEINSGLIV